MRIITALVGGVFFAMTLAAIGAPWLIEQPALQKRAQSLVASLSGGQIEIDGPVGLRVFPQPRLTMQNPRIRAMTQPVQTSGIYMDRLNLDLRLIALLLGRFEPTSIHVINPSLTLQSSFEHISANIGELLATFETNHAFRLRVEEGSVDLNTLARTVSRIDLTIERDAQSGRTEIEFTGNSGAAELNLDLQTGRIRLGDPASLQLTGTVLINGATSLVNFSGTFVPDPSGSSLNGEVNLGLENAADMVRWMMPQPTDRFDWLEPLQDVTLEGDFQVTPESVAINRAVASMGGQVVRGSAEVLRDDGPRFDIEARTDLVVLPEEFMGREAVEALASALPANAIGTVTARAEEVVWRNASFQQAYIDAMLEDDRRFRIKNFRMGVPGSGNLSFEGVLAMPEAGPRLEGDVSLAIRDTQPFMAAIGIEGLGEPQSTEQFSLESKLVLDRARLIAKDTQIQLGAMRANADVDWLADPTPKLTMALDIERINVDQLAADIGYQGSIAQIIEWLTPIESDLDIGARRLIHDGRRVDGVRIVARGSNGTFEVERASIADIAGADIVLAGRFDSGSEAFNFSTKVVISSPSRFLRVLTDTPLGLAALVHPVEIAGEIQGNNSSHKSDWVVEGNGYFGTVVFLADDLFDPRTFQIDANLVAESVEKAFSGLEDTANLTPMLTGDARMELQLGATDRNISKLDLSGSMGPISIEADLDAADPSLSCLGGSVDVGWVSDRAGAEIDEALSLIGGFVRNSMPANEFPQRTEWLDWRNFAEANCENRISLFSDTGDQFTLHTEHQPGRIDIRQLQVRWLEQQLDARGFLSASPEEPSETVFMATLNARHVALKPILDELVRDGEVTGTVTATMDVTAKGASVEQTLAHLSGSGSVTLNNLTIPNQDGQIETMTGQLAIDGGILAFDLMSSKADDQKRLTLVVDLPAWLFEASLQQPTEAPRYWLGPIRDVREFTPISE